MKNGPSITQSHYKIMYCNILSLVNGLVLPRLLTDMVHIHLFISDVCGVCTYTGAYQLCVLSLWSSMLIISYIYCDFTYSGRV
jgi:hypothetical protein